jgi:hypothetical protein
VYKLEMRLLLSGVAGLLTTIAAWFVLGGFLLIAGGTECDRSSCNGLGEFTATHSPLVAALLGVSALAAGVFVARRLMSTGWRR